MVTQTHQITHEPHQITRDKWLILGKGQGADPHQITHLGERLGPAYELTYLSGQRLGEDRPSLTLPPALSPI